MTQLPAPWMVRSLSVRDVPSLLQLQTICYGDMFLESEEVFARRLASEYQCSLGVVQPGDTALHAYLVGYWSNFGKVTPLNGEFNAPAPGAQVLYLHDMSVHPHLSGQGVAKHLLERLLQMGRERGVAQACLVSVQGSQTYWERQGFSLCPVHDTQQQRNLETYGQGAVYMARAL